MKQTAKGFKMIRYAGKLLLLLFMLLQGGYGMAQDGDEKEGDDIKAVRVAFMTDKLKLTSDEAKKFWPVYNNYMQEKRKAWRDNIGDPLKRKESVLNVQKKYKDEFKRVLNSDDRANRVYIVEDEFKIMLHNEWQKRHPNGGNGNGHLLPASGKRN